MMSIFFISAITVSGKCITQVKVQIFANLSELLLTGGKKWL